jgi:hypothetical protein
MKDASSLGSRADYPEGCPNPVRNTRTAKYCACAQNLVNAHFWCSGWVIRGRNARGQNQIPAPMFHLKMESFISFDLKKHTKRILKVQHRHSSYAAFAISATGGNAVCNFAIVSPSITFVVLRLLCAWNCANADKVCWPAIPSTSPG